MSSGLWSYGRSAAGDRVEVAQNCLPTTQCTHVVLDDEAAGLSPSPEVVRGIHQFHSDPTALDKDDDDFGGYDLDVSPMPSKYGKGATSEDTEVAIYDDFYVHNDLADVGEWFQKMTSGDDGVVPRSPNVVSAHDSCRRQAREHLAELAHLTTPTTPLINPIEIVERSETPTTTTTQSSTSLKNPVRSKSSTRTLLAKQQMVVAAERRRAHLNSVVHSKPLHSPTATPVPVPPRLRTASQSASAVCSGVRSLGCGPASTRGSTPSVTRPTTTVFKAPPSLPPPTSTTTSSSSTPQPSFDQVLAARHAERKLARSALKHQSVASFPTTAKPELVVPLVASRRRDVRVASYVRNAERDIQLHSIAVRSDRIRLLRGALHKMRNIVHKSQAARSTRHQQAILGCMRAVFTGWALLAHKRASATRLRILNAERLASSSMGRWIGVVDKRRYDIQRAPRAYLGIVAAKLLRRVVARRITRDAIHEEALLGLHEVRAWRVKSMCWRRMITTMERRAVERARVQYRSRMAQRAAEILNLDPNEIVEELMEIVCKF